MNLTTSQIKEILESPEDVSPKCLAIIIADMTEHIDRLECSYNILSTKYEQLKSTYVKCHLNSVYGKIVTDALKDEHKYYLLRGYRDASNKENPNHE